MQADNTPGQGLYPAASSGYLGSFTIGIRHLPIMHLFYLVNGLYGSPGHMRTPAECIQASLDASGGDHIVHVANTVTKFKTLDGIEINALRLLEELLDKLNEHPEISQISLIGYSMGGLYMRYLAGLLYSKGVFDKITPVNFFTIATPHLGATMWKPGVTMWNLMGNVLLGPSGSELMTRGPNGVLDKMSQPNSIYYKGLQKFSNLMLICNAVGDRSVNFWTSYMTFKHPFPRRDHETYEYTMYKLGEESYGKFLVDMQAPIVRLPKRKKEEEETKTTLNFAWAFAPLVITLLLGVRLVKSTYLWGVKLYLRRKCDKLISSTLACLKPTHHSDKGESISDQTRLDSTSGGDDFLSKEIQSMMEEGPIEEDYHVENMMISEDSPAKPVINNKSKLIDECTNVIEMNEPILKRMENLNKLPWKKYVAYLDHYRTHAFIVDRMHEGDSTATDLLRFMADQLQR